jgi:hypothetical protein
MSVMDGQRVVSVRRRITAYCEQHGIIVPASFHQQDIVYAIAMVDVSVAQEHRLVDQTFYNHKTVVLWLLDHNRHPENYRVLDFKRGVELVLEHPVQFIRGPKFDHRRDVDVRR